MKYGQNDYSLLETSNALMFLARMHFFLYLSKKMRRLYFWQQTRYNRPLDCQEIKVNFWPLHKDSARQPSSCKHRLISGHCLRDESLNWWARLYELLGWGWVALMKQASPPGTGAGRLFPQQFWRVGCWLQMPPDDTLKNFASSKLRPQALCQKYNSFIITAACDAKVNASMMHGCF